MPTHPTPVSTPPGGRGKRSIRGNPNFPPQPGIQSTSERRKLAAAATSSLGASPSPTPKSTGKEKRNSASSARKNPTVPPALNDLAVASPTTRKSAAKSLATVNSSAVALVDSAASALVDSQAAATVSTAAAVSAAAATNSPTAAPSTSVAAASAPNISTLMDPTLVTSGSGEKEKRRDSDNDSEDGGSSDGRDDDDDDDDDRYASANESETVSKRLAEMEGRISRLEAENLKMRGELGELRDRVEEEEWARGNMERKVEEHEKMEKEVTALRKEVAKEKSEREKREREMEMRISEKLKGSQGVARKEVVNERNKRSHPIQKKRCIVFTDSNGKMITEEMIKIHIPRTEREAYDILPVVAPTVETAYHMVAKGEVDVRGAVVVVDNLTNDVRGNPNRPSATPQELIRRVDRLRERVRMASAVAVVVCEVKPMQVTDVRPHNTLLDSYLRSKGRTGYGCSTQIQMNTLKPDGYHINPSEFSVLAKTYACAIQGLPVPCPTPVDDFIPLMERRRYEVEWPRVDNRDGPQGRVSQGQNLNHGWLW